ncbi:hypothetical protein GWK41_03370 [Persephonella atlantica]|uniref:Uncharacterized protein n=1 Tax=Persephonella atlantica TaxID=2699429 RepID=A0ABS1GH08_9AQUI|nr:hypothetical protein [Persephonella atlantica]MBK3332106.1 hypothetical protein [Persephonella atlantica]
MRRLIILLAVFVYAVKGLSQEVDKSVLYEIKILEKLVIDVTKKRYPSVYFYGVKKEKIFLINRYSTLRQVYSIEDADFVFLKNRKNPFKADKPTLALDFRSLKNCGFCIGVFSWKNGRPILILFQENLEKFRIVLPEEYRYFIESKMMSIGKR